MMRSERPGDLILAVRAALRGDRAQLWTALPGIVQSFDPSTVSATVQPSVQAQTQDKKGKWSDVTLPLLTQVPVLFPSGGGFLLTFPVASGDEGLVVFASRCIDSWWQSGGIQRQPDLRMHDLSDGFFIPGAFSNLRARDISPSPNTASVQLRSLDGETLLDMSPGKVQLIADEVVIHARTKLSMDAGGTGSVVQVDQIDNYTMGVPTTAHPPHPPEVP